MFKTTGIVIALTVVVLLAAVLIIAATKPDSFHVQRTTSIDAPPEKIFALIDDFHHWGAWSPYEKLDLAMKKTISGAASGTGAVYEWEGNSKAGKGRMEIAQSSPPSLVTIDLHFMKPMDSRSIARFTLQPKGGATEVTWSMDGASPYISKIFQVFFDMDQLIGKDFETGLASLKSVAEK